MRLRPLSEIECYLRCYGQRADDSVRVVERLPAPPTVRLTAEHVRRLFAERLEQREPEAEAA